MNEKSTQVKTSVMQQCFSHRNMVCQGDSLAEQVESERGKSHNAQTTDLDEAEDYALPEAGIMLSGINYRETGDTGGRGGSEECIYPACPQTWLGTDVQVKEKSPSTNCQGKEEDGEEKRADKSASMLHSLNVAQIRQRVQIMPGS